MRSFSNIMTNFAGNLHLLVDSIRHQYFFKKVKKRFDMIRFSKKGCIFVP